MKRHTTQRLYLTNATGAIANVIQNSSNKCMLDTVQSHRLSDTARDDD